MLKDGETTTFDCPFCGAYCESGSIKVEGRFVLGTLHAMPLCPRFIALEPDDFLEAVNDAMFDPAELATVRAEFDRKTKR